ncbi:MAG: NAD(P)/FAD-dependent oxidoreductase [Planctomycetota bacterium]
MGVEGDVDLIVVGGGAAGLAAAVAAESTGLTCQILEAQDDLGGRIRTVPLATGGTFDQGAQTVNADMHHVLELAEHAGMPISPVPETGTSLRVVRDTVFPARDLIDIDELYDLIEEHVVRWDTVGEALRALWLSVKWWATPWESAGEAGRAVSRLAPHRSAPRGSLGAVLRSMLLSPEDDAIARSHLTEAYGAALDEIDAHAVREQLSRYDSHRTDLEFQFSIGMDGIVDALASKLHRAPRLGTPVTHMRTTAGRVQVRTDAGVWCADHVVVTVPPPVARRIEFDIDEHDRLAQLLDSFAAGAVIKIALVYETAFWRPKGLSGWVLFGEPSGLAVIDASPDDGQLPQLMAYAGGPLARHWAALSAHDRCTRLLDLIGAPLGEQAAAPVEVAEAIWVDHPWCGGGYNAFVRRGGNRDAAPQLAAWDGPVRFAGAELDDRFCGYVEGAINSGRSAVARLLKDVPVASTSRL